MSVLVLETPPESPPLPRSPHYRRPRSYSAGASSSGRASRSAVAPAPPLESPQTQVQAAAAAAAAARARRGPRAALRPGLLGAVLSAQRQKTSLTQKSGSFTSQAAQGDGRKWRYEIHELCGEGSFGSVYRATDAIENRAVAIKGESWRAGAVFEGTHGRFDGFEHHRRVAHGHVINTGIATAQRAIEDDQPRQMIGKIGGKVDRKTAGHGMTHHHRPIPAEMR